MPATSMSPAAVSDPDAPSRATQRTAKSPAAVESSGDGARLTSRSLPAVVAGTAVAAEVLAAANAFASTSVVSLLGVTAASRPITITLPVVADTILNWTSSVNPDA